MQETPGRVVRDATAADAPACAAIYAHYVRHTAATFEDEPPTTAVMASRIAAAQRGHAWLVLQQQREVVGYAYAGPHRSRAAYRWSCEVSVYLAVGRERTGGGRMLYTALLQRLRERGLRTAVAGVALPNAASLGLHRALGFQPVGVFRRIGFKHGAWHDVEYLQYPLSPDTGPPSPLSRPG